MDEGTSDCIIFNVLTDAYYIYIGGSVCFGWHGWARSINNTLVFLRPAVGGQHWCMDSTLFVQLTIVKDRGSLLTVNAFSDKVENLSTLAKGVKKKLGKAKVAVLRCCSAANNGLVLGKMNNTWT